MTSTKFEKVIALANEAGAAFKANTTEARETILPMCVKATREAVKAGYLVDGREVPKDERTANGQVTNAEFAGHFGLTNGSAVTRWRNLAKALDLGVKIGSPVWRCLIGREAGGSQGVSAKKVSEAINAPGATVESVKAALEAEGWDTKKATKGPKKGPAKPDDGGREGKGADEPTDKDTDETPVSPYEAAVAALKVLRTVEKSPTIDAEAWERLGGIMLGMVASGDKRRGIVRPGVTSPTEEKVAS